MASSLGSLSVQQTLKLTSLCLEKARGTKDSELALELCDDAEAALSGIKSSQRKALITSKKDEDQALSKGIATSYINLSTLQGGLGRSDKAHANFKKAVQWGGDKEQSSSNNNVKSGTPAEGKQEAQEGSGPGARTSIARISQNIFAENVNPPAIVFTPPQPDERLNDIRQLAACLSLLRPSCPSDDVLEPAARDWLKVVESNVDEQERLRMLATEVIRGFVADELKDAKAVAELTCLAPVLDQQDFHFLLRQFYSSIDQSDLLNINHLQGLADLIQGAHPGYLDSDDLVKILGLLSTRLRETHRQSSVYVYQLTQAISQVLDAMADTKVNGLDREKLHAPLGSYLDKLRGSSDPHLVYQVAYAYQALLYVPDNETPWQAALRRTGKVIQGVSGLVSAAKGLDLDRFMEGLGSIQQGMAGASGILSVVKTASKHATSLAEGGKDFLDGLQEGFSVEQKQAWYPALRGADALIRDGHLAKFKILICEAPCRRDPVFQWGVCQRLGEIAYNPLWGADIQRGAVSFLDEMYRNDTEWEQQVDIKQWILAILGQFSSQSGSVGQYAAKVLEELRTDGDTGKQAMYQSHRENGQGLHTLRINMQFLEKSPLLDRAQNRPDVEGSLRQLRKRRLEEQKNIIYIPPQAKASLHAPDGDHFPLMEAVLGFLNSDQRQVLLLLGDSGSGKSTFNKALECELWNSYKKGGPIPLHISLPTIDKPDQDMVTKQLRRFDFSDAQIKELKDHREFILICDGYDECQQTRNLYTTNRLNQPDEWKAKMAISCRSEYIGADYRDRFQSGDRNQSSKSAQLQEAVFIPFSTSQVEDYIDQYVAVYQPLWRAHEYKDALDRIPSLRELVGNPFLMKLLLDVLPRMTDPGEHLSITRMTRVVLYDQFIEQWLERGKRRLAEEELSPSASAAFDSLSDEGFTTNGIDFLKKLSVAIYKEQDGQPIVEYSRFQDEGSWKSAFFGRSDDKNLLREACPLVRNGNQYRFIHRSMLEYGVARAIFDPQDWKERATPQPHSSRRGSMSSVFSFETQDVDERVASDIDQEPGFNSPLVWRSFVNEPSLLQFLVERVHQEPIFKKQLHSYIELSKKDKKWRTAAVNAITVLVRAGERFIGTDLRGIRIPGADLSYGVFDSVQLQEADMRKVNLQGVWLRQTDMSRANMTGVLFGELPYLHVDSDVWSCAFSSDGKSLAVGLESGEIYEYSTLDWQMVRILNGHNQTVRRIVYSPDGKWACSGSIDKTVRIWDMESGLCQHILVHADEVNCVAYSPNGFQVASASDTKVRLFNQGTGECCRTLTGHEKMVESIAYSPKGDQIASGSDDLTVRLWNVVTGECNHIFVGHCDEVWGIAFSPHGDRVASAGHDKTIRLWDVESGNCRHVLEGHIDGIIKVAFSPKGDQVISAGRDGTVRVWDAQSGSCSDTLTGHTDPVFCIAYSPKGGMVASGGSDDTVRLWDVSVGSRHISNGHSQGVRSVKCSPNGRLIATGGMDMTIRLWDVETGACIRILSGHVNSILGVAISPQGNRICSGSADTTVRLWDVDTGACQHILTGHIGYVYRNAYSPQGDQVVSAGDDNTVRLWNATTGEHCRTLNANTDDGVMSVAYSPDGSLIATGGTDCAVRLWDVTTLVCDFILIGHTGTIKEVVFSPRGDQLASSGNDCTVRLWSVGTGECCLILTGHEGWVPGIAYSQKGDLLASGSRDKTVRLWDIASGQCKAVQNFQGHVSGVAWIPSTNANYLVTGCQDGSVLKWQVIEGEGQCHFKPCWIATNGSLNVTGALIQDVRGLTLTNKQLLKQRGAEGEPKNQFQEANKKLITMASAVSQMKPLDGVASDSRSTINISDE